MIDLNPHSLVVHNAIMNRFSLHINAMASGLFYKVTMNL